MNMVINTQQIPIDQLQLLPDLSIDILRLDAIHPQVSGNKYFKLIKNIELAQQQGYQQIVTLGGAYSNHLHATAYMCNTLGMQSIGVIRGQEVSNHTLQECATWGMQFCFTDYKNWVNINYKQLLENIATSYPNAYFIPMGGDNLLGVAGMQLLEPYFANYDTIICSVGTGTTLAGIVKYTNVKQHIIGIQAVKDANTHSNIAYKSGGTHFTLLDAFTFGGFAKYDNRLLQFMQIMYTQFGLQLDFVYTAKTLYALYHGHLQTAIGDSKNILFVHTGGLQGNRGVPEIAEIYP
jgi:1-aminocyclopropane-1-carboxylate deaminase